MVEAVEATGGTALWDAIVSTLHALRSKARGVTRKLFILTDGEDQHSTESDFASCSAAVSKPGFVVEVVLVAVTSGIGGEAQKQLERLASDTWGSTNCSIKSRRCAPTSRHRRSARRFSLEILRRAARRMRRASTRGSALPARSVRFTTIRFTICSAKLWDTSA